MKTIEEKARAYDEVLNKLRHFIAKGVDPLITRADVQDFFPELKESEDEKIRKQIVNAIHDYAKRLEEKIPTEWLAWLEKQGRVKESAISQHEIETCKENDDSLTSDDEKVIDAIKHGLKCLGWEHVDGIKISDMNAWLEKQGDYANFRDKAQIGDRITKNEAGVLVNLSQLKRVAKPADKIEPKFKVGDKIYLKPEYRMPDDDTPIANTVKEIRRIDDKHYRFDGSYIFIEDQDKYELVEQKPAWSEEDSNILNGITAYLSCTACNIEGFGRWYDWLKSLQDRVQPKQEWSKEDDGVLLESISVLQNNCHWVLADKLKSLKDRVQPKQEWSEEDEKIINGLIDSLTRISLNTRTDSTSPNFSFYKEIDWLKSLRPQNNITDEELAQAKKNAYNDALDKIEYHSGEPTFDDGWSAAIDYIRKKSLRPQNKWKPSDEQMEALYKASKNEYLKADQYDVLLELWNNLKKLKEE